MGDDPAATDGEETDIEAEPTAESTRPDADVDGTRTSGEHPGGDGTATDAETPTAGGTPTDDTESDRSDAAADAAGDGDDASVDDSEATDSQGIGDSTTDEEDPTTGEGDAPGTDRPPEDVRKYERFKKVDGAQYDRVNDFLRDRTYITAREWAIARLCADFRTETGVEMTKIGNNLPYLVPFMTDTYSPQAVNQARHAFREKVRKSGATFLYGAMCGFFTAEELDELMYEVSEIAKFLLEVEGVDLAVAEELEAEERISSVMREVRAASSELRAEDLAEASDD
jgi:hypothetical protein